jgi:hypothetical protein
MSENKNAKTPADGPVAWSCQCGRPYTVTCISSKPQKKEWVGLTGMTLRDYFAAKAMQGLFSCGKAHDEHTAHVTAKASYLMADAMLKAREA